MRHLGSTLLAALFVAFTLPATPAAADPASGFSAVPLAPHVLEGLRAQGKKVDFHVPATANRGKKFNPTGTTVGTLATAPVQKVLVLFIDFPDAPPGGPATRTDLSTFDDMLFGTSYDPPEYAPYVGHPTDRTLKNYYRQVSYGAVDVITLNLPSTMGWARAAHPYAWYCTADGVHDNGFGAYPQNVQGLVIEAIQAADPYVDFSKYATDGVVPNLFVVHAGTGAEWSGAPDIIWSHSWDLTEGTGMAGFVADGVKLNNYAMMNEVGGDLTGFYNGEVDPAFPPTVGVYAHEYGHVLGLPDEYDYGYESEGTGALSLMAGGSWGVWPLSYIFLGNSPAFLDAWSRIRLGFTTPTLVTSATAVALPPAETSPLVYKMVVPFSSGKEYFLFENRQALGMDEGLKRYGLHGLAIYHVDETVLSRSYWLPNEAENWKLFRSEGAPKAANGETHYGISLMQADNGWHLEHGANAGDAGDLYPGYWGVTSFSSYSKPNSSAYYFWGGSDPKYGYSGVTADGIVERGTTINATLSFVPWKAPKK
jgi:M6 family metalloprotease-like protein